MVLRNNPRHTGKTRGLTLDYITIVILPEQHLEEGAVRAEALALECDRGPALHRPLELGGGGDGEDVIDRPGGLENG